MVPISGIMILFSVLMFGLAVAIPASRAMQEAEMRDRIASIAVTNEDDDDENSSGSADRTEPPALTEIDDASGSDDRTNPAPQPIEEISRGADIASTIEGIGVGDAEDEEPSRAPKPTHISIPGVEIDAEIHQVGYNIREIEGQRVREWDVASYAAGHHETSARPGEGGNIVVTGHNDWEGEVFRTLEYAEHGQEIVLTTEEGEHRYIIEEIHMRREVGASLEERLETGRFMADMPEERLTLITCWPYGINDHRVIVVAMPVD